MSVPESRRSVVNGAVWMVGARLGERVLGLMSTAVLARLLAPSDFGLVAMAMVFVAAADLLGAFGLDWALVRQKDLERRHLDTAWTIRTLLGLASFLVLVLIGGYVADFYREPRIQAMLVALGLSLLVGAIENPGVVIFRREMRFDKEFALRVSAKVAGMIVAVSMAFALHSYWALLFGTLAGRATSTVASYVMHSHRPRLTMAARAELMGFSTWLFIGNVLTFLRTRVVELSLGRIAGPKQLGLFAVANELSQLASTELAAPINRALFSDYVGRVDEPGEIGRAYLGAAPVIWAIGLPMAFGTYLVSAQVVMLLLGSQWTEAVPVLNLLAMAAVLGLLTTNALHVYWAIGRARLEAVVEGVAAVALLAGIWILVPGMGVIGGAWAVFISNAILVPLNFYLLKRYASVPYLATFGRLWRILVACGVMVMSVRSMAGNWVPTTAGAALLQASVIAAIGAVAYTTSLWFLWRVSGRPDGPESAALRLVMRRVARPGVEN